jgi:hypothetical protein
MIRYITTGSKRHKGGRKSVEGDRKEIITFVTLPPTVFEVNYFELPCLPPFTLLHAVGKFSTSGKILLIETVTLSKQCVD